MSRYMVNGLAAGVLALGIAAHAAGGPLAQNDPVLSLLVSSPRAALSPGGVVRLMVYTSDSPTAVEVDTFGRTVHLWPTRDRRTWYGLLGIGLETEPGSYDLIIRGISSDGRTIERRSALIVQPRSFDSRELRVSERFTDPPAAERERIAGDTQRLAEALAHSIADRLWRGPFVVPVDGRTTSSFGRLTFLNGHPQGRHQGADFRARTGTPVRAPNTGRVVLVAPLYFLGNTIILDHGGGLMSVLAHLSRTSVAEGRLVAKGDLLGESGATGRVTGPHLHWGTRLGTVNVDPQALIEAVADVDEGTDVPRLH